MGKITVTPCGDIEGLYIIGFDHNKIVANKDVIEFYKQLAVENIGGN